MTSPLDTSALVTSIREDAAGYGAMDMPAAARALHDAADAMERLARENGRLLFDCGEALKVKRRIEGVLKLEHEERERLARENAEMRALLEQRNTAPAVDAVNKETS